MSSIAYVTDKNMIEFHRLNGNSTINFWRPSSGKRFTDFSSGDLLFFLAKGTERTSSREKGLIGYGRFTESHPLSFRQMWGRYGVLNGYATEKQLKEAILRVAKSKTLPQRISCLTLTDVVFFQSPVYLSDLGFTISNNLESFLYLDREDPEVTTRILFKANEIGVDAWTSAVSSYAPTASVFDDDLFRYVLQLEASRLPDLATEKELAKAQRWLAAIKSAQPADQWLDARHHELIRFDASGITLTLAIAASRQELKTRLVYLIGLTRILEEATKQVPGQKKRDIRFILYCEGTILPEWQALVAPYPIRLESLDQEPKAD